MTVPGIWHCSVTAISGVGDPEQSPDWSNTEEPEHELVGVHPHAVHDASPLRLLPPSASRAPITCLVQAPPSGQGTSPLRLTHAENGFAIAGTQEGWLG